MIKSLDNHKSAGPNSETNIYRKRKNKPVKGLNENHARELLELHTISTPSLVLDRKPKESDDEEDDGALEQFR